MRAQLFSMNIPHSVTIINICSIVLFIIFLIKVWIMRWCLPQSIVFSSRWFHDLFVFFSCSNWSVVRAIRWNLCSPHALCTYTCKINDSKVNNYICYSYNINQLFMMQKLIFLLTCLSFLNKFRRIFQPKNFFEWVHTHSVTYFTDIPAVFFFHFLI